MNELSPRPYILVGIDGSASALHALTWAIGEAQVRNLPLRLVHAVDYGSYAVGFDPGAPTGLTEYLDRNGRRFLDEAAAHANALAPEVEVVLDQTSGRPIHALADLSRDAFLTVVGSSGLNAFTGMLAGSVAVGMIAHGHSPVVVVRAPGLPVKGPVLVGVDGAPDGEDAIGWAFAEASMRGTTLVALLVSTYVPAFYYYSDPPWQDMIGRVDETAQRELLAERLAGWQEKYPDVPVHRLVVEGTPAQVLLSHAQHAQLLVVGSRGRGDIGGLFLGSTSHRLIHHAPCPVLVVRPGSHEA